MKEYVPFDDLFVFARHDVAQGVLSLFLLLVYVNHFLFQGTYQKFTLVHKNHLDRFVRKPENDCVL